MERIAIEAPTGGEPIVFDNEEQSAIDCAIGRIAEGLKDTVLPVDKAARMEEGIGAIALLEVARRRMDSGDLRGAASAAVKAIGLAAYLPNTWLMLAEEARYGDYQAARSCLSQSDQSARSMEMRDDHWQSHRGVVRGMIR
ncbi:MAG: hypothetical protein ACYC9X_11230 [Dehalococcoidia bacterium]